MTLARRTGLACFGAAMAVCAIGWLLSLTGSECLGAALLVAAGTSGVGLLTMTRGLDGRRWMAISLIAGLVLLYSTQLIRCMR